MATFVFRSSDNKEVDKAVEKIDSNLRSNAIQKYFINGYAESFKVGFDRYVFVKAEPLININTFWFGIIVTSILVVILQRWSYWYLFSITPTLISFAWKKEFYFWMIKRAWKKGKIGSRTELLNEDEALELVYEWGKEKY